MAGQKTIRYNPDEKLIKLRNHLSLKIDTLNLYPILRRKLKIPLQERIKSMKTNLKDSIKKNLNHSCSNPQTQIKQSGQSS